MYICWFKILNINIKWRYCWNFAFKSEKFAIDFQCCRNTSFILLTIAITCLMSNILSHTGNTKNKTFITYMLLIFDKIYHFKYCHIIFLYREYAPLYSQYVCNIALSYRGIIIYLCIIGYSFIIFVLLFIYFAVLCFQS